MDLHINVCSLLSSPFVGGDSFCEIKSRIAESSPANMISRIMSIALSRLGHQDRFMALPSTSIMSRLFLMTTLCAALTELAMLKLMPRRAIGTTSRKTPMKKPSVTMEQLSRMGRDGRAERKK